MAVVALENGRLVPAQAVNTSDAGVTTESLAAIRERVVELIDVPLFPVAWQTEPGTGGSRESLIALDPTGQTVTVEVLEVLDADELLGSLARAGRHAEMSRSSVALIYGAGARSFPRDWHLFLDACPPHPAPGPRLYLIVLGIDDSVRSAVDALAGSGLDVRRASLHDGGSQVLVSFEELRPQPGRLGAILSSAQHYNELLIAESQSSEEFEAPAEPDEDVEGDGAGVVADSPEVVPDAVEDLADESPVEERADEAITEHDDATDVPEEPTAEESGTDPVEAAADDVTDGDVAAEVARDFAAESSVTEEASTGPQTAVNTPAVDAATADTPAEPSVSTAEQINQLHAMLTERKTPRHTHGRHPDSSRERPATESGPERPARLDPPVRVPSAFAGISGYTGPSAFAAQSHEGNRAEQDLWENSAPNRGERPAPQIISESTAANSSSEAVQEAAQREQSPSRLTQIAQRYGAPFTVVWSQRRRNINLSARVTAWGTMVLPDGRVFTDPSEAASAASQIASVDGWSVWRVPGGKRLGEL